MQRGECGWEKKQVEWMKGTRPSITLDGEVLLGISRAFGRN